MDLLLVFCTSVLGAEQGSGGDQGGVVPCGCCTKMTPFRFVLHHLHCLKTCRCVTILRRKLQRCHEPCLTLGVVRICSYTGCEGSSISCMVLTLKPVLHEMLMMVTALRGMGECSASSLLPRKRQGQDKEAFNYLE